MGSWAFIVIAALLQAATSVPSAPAQSQSSDLNSKLIKTPDSNWIIYGPDQSSKRIEKGGPKGYPAYEVSVAKPATNAWDDGAVSIIPKPIGAGDVVLIAVYLRNPALPDGQSETIPMVGATGASAPYPAIAGAPARVTNQWQVYFASGKALQAFAANGAQVTVHLASARHVIQLGPMKVYDLGADFDMRRLPH